MDQLDVATEIEVFYVLFHQSLLMIFIISHKRHKHKSSISCVKSSLTTP